MFTMNFPFAKLIGVKLPGLRFLAVAAINYGSAGEPSSFTVDYSWWRVTFGVRIFPMRPHCSALHHRPTDQSALVR